MEVVLSGIRPGDPPVPLVLVRCDLCAAVWWQLWHESYCACPCGARWGVPTGQPTLAQATAPRRCVA
jgi:hypothetical protein